MVYVIRSVLCSLLHVRNCTIDTLSLISEYTADIRSAIQFKHNYLGLVLAAYHHFLLTAGKE